MRDCSIPTPCHPITAPDHHGVSNSMLSREAAVFSLLQMRHLPAVEVDEPGLGSLWLQVSHLPLRDSTRFDKTMMKHGLHRTRPPGRLPLPPPPGLLHPPPLPPLPIHGRHLPNHFFYYCIYHRLQIIFFLFLLTCLKPLLLSDSHSLVSAVDRCQTHCGVDL